MKKSIFVAIALFLVTVLSCGVTTTAFAADNMDSSSILSDLEGSIVAGKLFDPSDYVYSQSKDPEVLTFAEFGYHYNGIVSDYNLYVYVYSPSGRDFFLQRNYISLATTYDSNGNAIDYDKFPLTLLGVTRGKYANLFAKYKVSNPTKVFSRVKEHSNKRVYDVGEIEINFGGTTSEAYSVGNRWVYSGFAKGYGADSTEGTLTCTTDRVETLKLAVNGTSYRYNNGVNEQTDLSSVYFGVPTSTIEEYGKLQQIKANWFETKTSDMLVMTDKDVYNRYKPEVGLWKATNTTFTGATTRDFLSAFPFQSGLDFSDIAYGWNYNGEYIGTESLSLGLESREYVGGFDWCFYAPNGKVTASSVLQAATDYTQTFGGDKLLDKYSSRLFVAEVDEGHQYGWQGVDKSGVVIDADSVFDVNGFTTGSSFLDWWEKLIYPDLETTTLENVQPIYVVSDSDVVGTSAEIAQRLLIDENDVVDFVSTYNLNKIQSKQTVLFRFATSQYTANELYYNYPSGIVTIQKDAGYIAQQTCYLDFDIIWLKFVKGDQQTVIPVVNSPIDIFHGLTAPLVNGLPSWVFWLIAAIVLLFLFAVFVKPLAEGIIWFFKIIGLAIYYVLYAVYWIVSTPIKWFIDLFR